MFRNSKIQSLQEDAIALGLMKKGEEITEEKGKEKGKEEKGKAEGKEKEGEGLDEAAKLIKKRRGTKARIAKRKAKKYYRKHKSSLKRKVKKWKKTSAGKRFKKLYKKAMKRFGGKVARGKRIQVSDEDVKLANLMIEGYEAILRIVDLTETAQSIDSGIAKMLENVENLFEEIGRVAGDNLDEQDDEEDDEECEGDEDEEDEEDMDEGEDATDAELSEALDNFYKIVDRAEEELQLVEDNLEELNEEEADKNLKKASKTFQEAYEAYEELIA